jgi:hypothetical protein
MRVRKSAQNTKRHLLEQITRKIYVYGRRLSPIVSAVATLVWVFHHLLNPPAASARPYIGPVAYHLIYCEVVGSDCFPSDRRKANNLEINLELKNSGLIAADSVVVDRRVFVNGIEQQQDGKDQPSRIQPGQSFLMLGETGMEHFGRILSGQERVEFRTTVQYEWTGGHEERCYLSRFVPESGTFIDLGSCSSAYL